MCDGCFCHCVVVVWVYVFCVFFDNIIELSSSLFGKVLCPWCVLCGDPDRLVGLP